MLLEQVKNVNFVDEELENEIQELSESISTVVEHAARELGMTAPGSNMRIPPPGTTDDAIRGQESPEDEDVLSTLDVIVKQMVAAKKAMTILNRMADSSSRTKNKSRVMGNLNRIRGSLQRVVKIMDRTGAGQTPENRNNYNPNI